MIWNVFTIVALVSLLASVFIVAYRIRQGVTEEKRIELDYIRESTKREIMDGYTGFRDRWSVEEDHQADAMRYVATCVDSSNLSDKWMASAKKVLAYKQEEEHTCLYCGTVSDDGGSCPKCGAPKPRCLVGGK